MQVEYLDLLGKGDPLEFDPRLFVPEDRLSNLRKISPSQHEYFRTHPGLYSLVIEQTVSRVGIFENGSQVATFPTIWRGCPSPETSEKINRYSLWFSVTKLNTSVSVNNSLLPILYGLVGYLQVRHSSLTFTDKQLLKDCLFHSVSCISEVIAQQEQLETLPEVKVGLDGLVGRLGSWVGGTAGYPDNLTVMFFEHILVLCRGKSPVPKGKFEWKNIASLSDYSIVELSSELTRPIIRTFRNAVEGYSHNCREYFTDQYKVVESANRIRFSRRDGINEDLHMLVPYLPYDGGWCTLKVKLTAVIPHIDTVVIHRWQSQCDGVVQELIIVDLKKPEAQLQIRSVSGGSFKWFAGDTGLIIWGLNNLIRYYPYQPLQTKETYYSGIPIHLSTLKLDAHRCSKDFQSVAVTQSNKNKDYFMLIKLPNIVANNTAPENPSITSKEAEDESWVWRFACLDTRRVPGIVTAKVFGDFVIPNTRKGNKSSMHLNNKAFWVQNKQHKIFGCVNYDPDGKENGDCLVGNCHSCLFVVTFWKNKIVPISSNSCTTRGTLQMKLHDHKCLSEVTHGSTTQQLVKLIVQDTNPQRIILRTLVF